MLLPTGSRKTVCYSCSPWTFDELKCKTAWSILFVVGPLMKDQVTALQWKCSSAVHVTRVNSQVDNKLVEELYEGQCQVVFFSPESLLTEETWRDMQSEIYQENTVRFIVDEAHCVTMVRLKTMLYV